MNLFARLVELCAIFGANCVSVCLTYQPKMPKSLM